MKMIYNKQANARALYAAEKYHRLALILLDLEMPTLCSLGVLLLLGSFLLSLALLPLVINLDDFQGLLHPRVNLQKSSQF